MIIVATAGKGGKVVIDTDTIGEIGEWSTDESINLEETPTFGDEVVTHTGTLLSASGSFSGYFDKADIDKVEPGADITNLELYVDDTANIAASAIIADRSVSTPVEGVSEIDIDFEFQAKPTWTTT